MEVIGTIVSALNTNQVAPMEAAAVDVGDPAEMALEVGRRSSWLEGNDIAALDDIASMALDAGGSGCGGSEKGRGGRGKVLEVDHSKDTGYGERKKAYEKGFER